MRIAGPAGRYAYYQATFTGDGTATPSLTLTNLEYAGADSSSRTLFAYDAAGNMVSRTTMTASGTTTDVRDDESWIEADRVNGLNQIKRQDVTVPGSAMVTTRYAYDASGNLTSKTDGTSTWSYDWDEDNRLIQVTLPGPGRSRPERR